MIMKQIHTIKTRIIVKNFMMISGKLNKSICLALLLLSRPSIALEALDDREMSGVVGQDGISMMLNNVSLSGTHTITYSPTAGETLDIKNLLIDNATASTAATGGATVGSTTNPFTLDIDGTNGLEFAMPVAGSGVMDNFHLGIGELLINSFLVGAVDIYGLNLEGTSIAIRANRYSAAAALTESVLVQCSNFNFSGNCSIFGGDPQYQDFVRRPQLFNSNILIAVALQANIEQLKITPPTATGEVEFNGLSIDNGAGGAWNLGNVAIDIGSGYDVGAANNFGSQFDSNGNLATRLGPGMFISISGGGAGNIRVNNVVWQETATFTNQQTPGTPVDMGAVRIDGLTLTKIEITL